MCTHVRWGSNCKLQRLLDNTEHLAISRSSVSMLREQLQKLMFCLCTQPMLLLLLLAASIKGEEKVSISQILSHKATPNLMLFMNSGEYMW
jgi:hypothetical protein